LALSPAPGGGRFIPDPGCITSTNRRPTSKEIREAATNQDRVLSAMRPIDRVSSMFETPETTVANTRGAMIILTSRRKTSLMIEK
jgi:hypothetical protein